jgi:hypothetical protein
MMFSYKVMMDYVFCTHLETFTFPFIILTSESHKHSFLYAGILSYFFSEIETKLKEEIGSKDFGRNKNNNNNNSCQNKVFGNIIAKYNNNSRQNKVLGNIIAKYN